MPGKQRRSEGTSGQSKKEPELDLEVSDEDYKQMNIHTKTGLDAIALGLLKLQYRKDRKEPKFLNYNCVAVCCVGKELWISSNGLSISKEVVHELKDKISGKFESRIVNNRGRDHGVDKMHAEMKLLAQLIKEKKQCTPSYMGVSKACCQHCAKCLKKFEIEFKASHSKYIELYELPINCDKKCNDCPKRTMLKEWDKPKTGY